MIETSGPRQTAPSGPAASLPAVQAGEKVVHRPESKVMPTEKVERTAPTGPRPTFQHSYLEQLAAYWPDEPDPPVTYVDYDVEDEDAPHPDSSPDEDGAPAPETRGAEEGLMVLRADDTDSRPKVDVRW